MSRQDAWLLKFGVTRATEFHGYYSNETGGCWEWRGWLEPTGYGKFVDGKLRVAAHRYAFFLATGVIPDTIDHVCRNRKCVNPAHLDNTDRVTNTMRGLGICAVNARKLACKRGHPLSGTNMRVANKGNHMGRVCKACRDLRQKASRAKKRVAPTSEKET